MTNLRFGVNRMVAPTLPLPRFLDLASRVGVAGVELRNDLPGFDVTDGIESARLREMLAENGLSVVSINAVQHFNLPEALPEATTELRRLIGFAAELGNPGIVMCPHCDVSDRRSRDRMRTDTIAALRTIAPILEDSGVIGLVEPLGFPESSLRDTPVAVEILGEIGSSALRLTLDTFHFAVAGLEPVILGTPEIPVDLIGLVHLSGVVADGPVGAFRDPDRVYVDERDRVKNRESLSRLRATGFDGVASFEPFSPSVHALEFDDMIRSIDQSMRHIAA